MIAFQHQNTQCEILLPHCFTNVTEVLVWAVRNILYTVHFVWCNNTQLKPETPSAKCKLSTVNFESLSNITPKHL
jgi:hypothetical protein